MLQAILFQVVTAAVLIVVLYLFFGNQVRDALNRLQVLHQESLEKEEIINKELERAKLQSQSEIARSQEEAKNILDTSRASAEKIVLEASERGQIEAKKLLADAEEKAKRMEQEILADIDAKAVFLAQELIKFTFTQKGFEALQAQLIDELIEEFKNVDKNRLLVNTDKVEVVTSVSLTPDEERKLKEVLVAKMGRALIIEEKIDPQLISGLVIKLGGLVVDGSFKNKLTRSVSALHLKR